MPQHCRPVSRSGCNNACRAVAPLAQPQSCGDATPPPLTFCTVSKCGVITPRCLVDARCSPCYPCCGRPVCKDPCTFEEEYRAIMGSNNSYSEFEDGGSRRANCCFMPNPNTRTKSLNSCNKPSLGAVRPRSQFGGLACCRPEECRRPVVCCKREPIKDCCVPDKCDKTTVHNKPKKRKRKSIKSNTCLPRKMNCNPNINRYEPKACFNPEPCCEYGFYCENDPCLQYDSCFKNDSFYRVTPNRHTGFCR